MSTTLILDRHYLTTKGNARQIQENPQSVVEIESGPSSNKV